MAAVLTFLSASSTDATYNLKSLAPPCPGPLQLRQHKASSRHTGDKMSELLKSHDSFVLRKPPHVQIKQSKPAYLIRKPHIISPRNHNNNHCHTNSPFRTEFRRVSPEKKQRPFCVKACAEKKKKRRDA